jgi:hypothetical protein
LREEKEPNLFKEIEVNKKPRTHNPAWKDNTRTQRTDKRKAEMQAAAIRDGFATWSEAITAWKNGDAVLVKK